MLSAGLPFDLLCPIAVWLTFVPLFGPGDLTWSVDAAPRRFRG
jgi:hypothetical protein